MPYQQRLLMILGALWVAFYVARRIRKKKIQMEDAIYWVLLSALLLVLAAFPEITFFFAHLFGFVSPSNFVFFVIIGLLVIREFRNSTEISLLRHKLNELAQESALQEEDLDARLGSGNDKRGGAEG